MVRAIWTKSLAVALVFVGSAWSQQPAAAPPVYSKGDTITLTEPGKGEVKVKVIKAARTSDGKMTYEVQDPQSGDKATITDSPMSMPRAEAPAPKKGLARIFSRPTRTTKKNDTSSEMKPVTKTAKEKIEIQMMPAGATKEESSGMLKPVSGTKQKGLSKENASSKAMPSDWHQSWGKADDHQTNVDKQIQLTSYAPLPMDMEPQPQVEDTTMTIKNCSLPGNPYWHVPKMNNTQAGVARVSR